MSFFSSCSISGSRYGPKMSFLRSIGLSGLSMGMILPFSFVSQSRRFCGEVEANYLNVSSWYVSFSSCYYVREELCSFTSVGGVPSPGCFLCGC